MRELKLDGVDWGDVATWVSAILAACLALYLARRSDVPRANVSLSVVLIGPDFDTPLLSFRVSNLGTHSLRISNCFLEYRRGFRWLFSWPAAVANNWQHPLNWPLPADLQRGESFSYMTSGDGRFGEFLAKSSLPAAIAVHCVRAGVSTPWGPIYIPIARDTKRMLVKSIKAARRESKEKPRP